MENNYQPTEQDPNSISLEGENPVLAHEVINPFVQPISNPQKTKNLSLWITIAAICVLLFLSMVAYVILKTQQKTTDNTGNTQKGSQTFTKVGLDELNLGQIGQLDVNGILMVNGGVVIKPSSQPEAPLLGQLYLNSGTKQLAYYDGSSFQTLATPTNSVTSIGGASGAISLGNGLILQGNTLSAQAITNTPSSAAVTSVQGQSGAVILVGGTGININGTTISNSGVTKINGKTGSITAGRGISTSGNTLLSTVSLSSASATLIVTDDGNGNYTISQVGSGSSGSVALGPALAQTDASNFPSIAIDKTGIGNLIEFSVGGVNRFVVGQGGAITTGSIGYSQITGLPQIVNNFTDGSSNTATGAIILGSGLALSGNTIINTAAGGITAVNGTANQVTVNTNLGVVTLSLPQDIATNSTPQFTGITLTGLGNGIVQSSSGSLSAGSIDRNSGTLFTNQLSVANGGTGSNAAAGARTNLGAAASGANSDITSLSGLTTALSVGQGGTGNTNLTANGILYGNGAAAITSLVAGGSGLCLTSTAGAPTWAACPGSGGVSSVNTFTGAVTIQGTLNQVTVSNNTGTVTLSLPQDINTSSSPQFSSLTLTNNLSVQGATATIGTNAQSGSLILNDGSANTGTLLTAALGQNVVYTLPDPGQATATICLSTGNCAGAGSGVTTGGGTNGIIPVFTASQNIENSTLSQSGSVITASGSILVQGALGLTLGTSSSADGIVSFRTSAGTHTVSLQAPSSDPASNLVLRLPAADGGANDCLRTNGSGVLSFGACLSGAGGGSGGVVSIDGLSGTVTVNNATGSGSAITIDDATTLAKGIASFSSSYFTVTSGAVSIATGAITSTEIANGTITGTDIASGTIANANLANSSLTVSAGTGLSGGGSVALGGSTSLNVSYGSSSGTAVQGNTTLTCPSGAGNLTGGGTSITLGTGGTCGNISTVANPTFATSVTTAQFIMTGAGSNGTLQVGNLGQATAFTLPDPGAASATICLSTGNCAGAGTGVTTAGGTTNAIAKFTGSQTLGDSSISDNGTTVTVGVNLNVSGTVTLTNDLTVANGGTGASTFTSNGILYGNGTGALQATAAGATGECLLGNTGSAPTWGSCAGAAGGVSSLNTFTGGVTIQGTGNQVTVTNNTGTITLSLPQDINTNSSPQFSNVTLTGNLTAQGGSITAGTNTQAGTAYIYDGTSNFAAIQTAALGQNTTYTLPDPGVASVSLCLSTGNCAGAGTGVTTAGGTTNAIAKFTGSQTLGDSSITDNGSLVTIGAGSGTFSLQTTNIDISSGGAISGVSGYAQASGNFLQSGTGTFGTGTGAVSLNGAVTAASTVAVTTLGGADSATYLCRNTSNQIATCNTTGVGAAFLQGGNSFGATAVLGTNDSNSLTFETNNTTQATIAVGGAVTFKNSTDSSSGFQVQNAAGSYLLTVDTSLGLTKIQAPNSNPGTSPGSARLAIESNFTDSAGDESILDIGESALTGSLSGARLRYDGQSNTFYLSGTNAASVITALSFDRDVTNLNIGGANNATMNIGTATQTGTISLGRATVSNTISIGAAVGNGNTQTINIGTSGTAGSTTNVTIGSTVAGTTTLQSAGGVIISSVGTADNATYLCRNSSNIIATCNTTGTGAAFVQNGNSFGATAVLGTNDSNSLTFETNNTTQATIAVGGAVTFQNSANSTGALQVKNVAGRTLLNVDTTNTTFNFSDGAVIIDGLAPPSAPSVTNAAGGTLAAASYYYRIAAYNSSGYDSSGTAATTYPQVAGVNTKNTINWGSAVSGASGYFLYRSTNGTTFSRATVSGGGTTSVVDDGSLTYSGSYQLTSIQIGVLTPSSLNFTQAGSAINFGSATGIYKAAGGNLLFGAYNAGEGFVMQGDSFQFQDTTGYNTNFAITNTGATTFKNRTNSTSAFQIQNATNIPTVSVDTTHLGVGTAISGIDTLYVNGSIRTEDTSWTRVYDGAQERIRGMAVFNNVLYFGQGDSTGDGDVFYYDGTTVGTSYNGAQEHMTNLYVFNGKLYATQGSNAGDGDIFVCNPATAGAATMCDNAADWTTSYDGAFDEIDSMVAYNGKLYAGQGLSAGEGDILMCNPAVAGDAITCDNASDWSVSYNGSAESILSLTVYNGKLYAGQGSAAGSSGDVLVFDGANWTTSYDGAQEKIHALAVYNGKLYAGQGSSTGDGDIYVFDGSNWTFSYNGAQEDMRTLSVYNGKLYAGQDNDTGDGDIYVFDGYNWRISYDGAQERAYVGAVYNGKLYAGQGLSTGDGDLYAYSERLESQIRVAPSGSPSFNEQKQNFTQDVSILTQTNSTSAFQIQNASGTSLLNADTTNLDLTVGGNLLVSKASQTNQDWTKVSGTAGTIGGNTTTAIDRAYSSAVYNGSLYVGTNKTGAAEIYRYDGNNTWTRVTFAAGQVVNGGTSSIDEIRDMVVYNGNLYVGTNKSNSAEVYKYDGTTWSVTNTTPGSFSTTGNTSINQASRMIVFNGSLYMGTDENNSAEIYRYEGGSGTNAWTRVSYDGTHIANGNTQTPDGIDGFTILNNQLYVASGDGSVGAGLGVVVFRYDGGTTWTSVSPSVGSLGGSVTNMNFIYGFATYNNKIYAGTRKTSAGQAEVYRYDGGTTWTVVSQGTPGTIASGGTSGIEGINRATVYNGKLYVVTGGTDNAEVYRYDGGITWTKITQTTAGTVANGGTGSIDAYYALTEYNGSLYLGTGETGAAEVYRYSDNLIEARTSDTAAVFNVSSQTGNATIRNSTNSTTAFNIQNTAGESLFTVDSTNSSITLLGNNSGALQAFSATTTLTQSRQFTASVIAGGYIYRIAGSNSSTIQSDVEFARLNADGSIPANGQTGTWTATTSLPVNRDYHSATTMNGYIYVLGGSSVFNGGDVQNTVYYAKINTDGTLGSWVTNSATLPGARESGVAAAYNGYVYYVGGNDNVTSTTNVYYGKVNPDGSINSFGSTTALTNGRHYPGLAIANGYMYVVGGTTFGPTTYHNTVYYAKINTDGTVGTWNSDSDTLPTTSGYGSAVVMNGYIYYLGGYNGSPQDDVYYASLNSDGSIGSWITQAAWIPANRDSFGVGTANGYVYIVGGEPGNGTAANTVYYASTSRVTIGGNLDLVGISGENLNEGVSGGNLTAGNTRVVGTLNVQHQASFQQNVNVGGTLTVQSGIYSGQDIKIGRQTNSGGTTADWSVTNSTAGTFLSNSAINSVEAMAVYNGSLYIGTYDSAAGSGEVYRYDESANTYSLVSSTGFGNSVDRVQSLIVYNGYLYAGTYKNNAAEVYRYDGGTTWTAITGTAGTIGGNDTNVDAVFGMAVWHGKLYIGTYASGGLSEVYRYDGGSTWADLITTAGNICGTGGNDYVHELEVFQDQLYAATFGGADVCRYDGGTTWTRVNAASGQMATGGTTGIKGVESMAVFNGALYAGTYDDDAVGDGNGAIYRYDGGAAGSWVKVSNATDGTIVGGGTTNIDIVATLVPYSGKLYAGTWGTTNTDKAEVYVFDPVANTWSKISQTTAGTIRSGGTANINGVIQMIVFNNKLYAATGEANSAEVYKFSAVSDQSYALKFSAGSNTVSGTEQGTYFNEGSIYFAANLQGSNTNDNSTTGSFVFSNGITTASGSYDVAEDYPTRDGLLSAGDVVIIDPDETGFVKRSDSKMQNTIVGVFSEKPGLRLGQKDVTINGGNAVPVALAGRVPVKVTNENGPIQPGDFLTSSSIPGYAMKATQPGPTIGKALGSFNGNTGKVLAFVNVSYYAPPSGSILQANQTMGGNLNVQGSGTFAGDLNVGGAANIATLKVSGKATFENDVTVVGSLTTNTITINGHIITGGEAPTVVVAQTSIQNEEIKVEGNDSSGTITIDIPANAAVTEGDIVKLIFAKSYAKVPKVVISPVGPESAKIGAYVDQKQTEFVLGVSTPPPADATYKFNYFIVE